MDKEPVLMVGGTGALGRKVVSELLNRDRRVRMLVCDPVKAEEFARRGVVPRPARGCRALGRRTRII